MSDFCRRCGCASGAHDRQLRHHRTATACASCDCPAFRADRTGLLIAVVLVLAVVVYLALSPLGAWL